YVAVYDKDHQHGKSADAIASADTSTKKIDEAINTEIGSSIILVNDIEEELGLPKGGSNKPYVALSHITSVDFSMNNGIESKIRTVYR
ncbi:hypothetical protein KN536_004463, partial [Escherichia coli]|nr:hypothetical protein [Escherichia coli]